MFRNDLIFGGEFENFFFRGAKKTKTTFAKVARGKTLIAEQKVNQYNLSRRAIESSGTEK